MVDLLNKIELIEQEMDVDLFGGHEDPEDRLFVRMAEFIINLEPDDLSDEDLATALNIIEDLGEFLDVEELEEVRKPKMSGKTSATKKAYARKWYRTSKHKIKRRKQKFRRSAEGRKRLRMKERKARIGRTPTGKKRVRYHVSHKTEKERGG